MASYRNNPRAFTGDDLGIALACICLLYCLGLLALACCVPWFLERLGVGKGLHQVLAFVSLFIGLATLLPGYQIHQRRRVLLLGGVGIVFLVGGALAPQDLCCNFRLASNERDLATHLTFTSILATAATPVGCCFLIVAHLINRRCWHSRSPSNTCPIRSFPRIR